MSWKRASRKKRSPKPKERKRRELQGYLDKLKRVPDKTPQDWDLQRELEVALSDMRRQ